MIQSRISWRQIPAHFSNFIERIDDQTYKSVCRQCGGKGYYLHQNYDLTRGVIDKQEIVNCDQCESGFIYGEKK